MGDRQAPRHMTTDAPPRLYLVTVTKVERVHVPVFATSEQDAASIATDGLHEDSSEWLGNSTNWDLVSQTVESISPITTLSDAPEDVRDLEPGATNAARSNVEEWPREEWTRNKVLGLFHDAVKGEYSVRRFLELLMRRTA